MPSSSLRAITLTNAPEATLAERLADLLAVQELDCLVITSPYFSHTEQIRDEVRLRPLPLLVKKPQLTDPADITPLSALAAAYPAPIWVAMEFR